MLCYHMNISQESGAVRALATRAAAQYWVTGQDIAQETEKWAEWAALASAADSAHFSVSCATSCPVTQ